MQKSPIFRFGTTRKFFHAIGKKEKCPLLIGGGVLGSLVDVSQNFWKLVDVFFPKTGIFFEIFEMYLPTSQKSLYIAFLFTNFPNISKKVLKNFQISKKVLKIFCGALGAAENLSFTIFCLPHILGQYTQFKGPTTLLNSIFERHLKPFHTWQMYLQ